MFGFKERYKLCVDLRKLKRRLQIDVGAVFIRFERPHMSRRGQNERSGNAEVRKKHFAEFGIDRFFRSVSTTDNVTF